MSARILVVQEAFVARGKGVLLAPRFTAPADAKREPFRVRLRLPGGAARETWAVLEVSHMRGSLPPFAMLRLPEEEPSAVPPGTEVWPAE